MTPQEFTRYVNDEVTRWRRVVSDAVGYSPRNTHQVEADLPSAPPPSRSTKWPTASAPRTRRAPSP